jgi:hypothetical protein
MADHSRKIQVRVHDDPTSVKVPNKGITLAWRVKPEDHVWFVHCSNGQSVAKEAVFPYGSPFDGDPVGQPVTVPVDKLPTNDTPTNEKLVKPGLVAGTYKFVIQTQETKPTELITGQIDIDP